MEKYLKNNISFQEYQIERIFKIMKDEGESNNKIEKIIKNLTGKKVKIRNGKIFIL